VAVPQKRDAARFSLSSQSIASGGYNLGRIGTNSLVRAFGNGHGTPGVFPEHEARHAQGSGFSLDAAPLQALLSPWVHRKMTGISIAMASIAGRRHISCMSGAILGRLGRALTIFSIFGRWLMKCALPRQHAV